MRAQCGNHAVLEEKAFSLPLPAAPSRGYFKYLSSQLILPPLYFYGYYLWMCLSYELNFNPPRNRVHGF